MTSFKLNNMKFLITFVFLQLLGNCLTLITEQKCTSFRSVLKTRLRWNNGQRMVTKRNFFGGMMYRYEPYMYSTVQNYHDYEHVSVCCDGYREISDDKCEPICRPLCPTNTHCIEPDICECDSGYIGYSSNAITIRCQPICLQECLENSECTEPNDCTCNDGYEENSDNGQCEPVCSKECPEYSKCTEPEKCHCHENYEMKEDKCWPICESACPKDAECLKPNTCVCKEGFEKVEELDGSSFKCLAKCDNGCPKNANCIQPNICKCLPGYTKSPDNICEPICQDECPLNSTCSQPNVCSCNKGYTMLDHHCQAICEKACPEYSSCAEPNICQCEAGYQLKFSSTYNLYCEPVCQSNCSTNGKCVQPNKCECLEGYAMDEMEVCQPVCSRGCTNGLCFQPDVCICKAGYLMGPQEECEPACSLPCQNGSCVEPEICQCHEGYKLQNNSVNLCEPICQPACINGICVDPNVCICHENYEPITTTQGELNHSNCQVIQTTTTARSEENEESTTSLMEITEKDAAAFTHDFPTNNPSTTLHSRHSKQTTSSPLVAAHICNAHCQCWQEFDEFGPLIAKRCIHLCADDFDKPCLDLKLCQCDEANNYLVCYSSDILLQQDDDPLYYTCNLEQLKTTTFNPLDTGMGRDMKSVQVSEESKFHWLWPVTVATLIAVCVIAGLLYVRYRKIEDPIMEYEL